MNATQVLGIIGAVTIMAVLFEMLRRHRLREKYAVIWFVISVGAIVVGLFPQLLMSVTELIGLQVPANLLFFIAAFVLLGLSSQHSAELVRAEERTRRLAEEVALMQLRLGRAELRASEAELRASAAEKRGQAEPPPGTA